MFNAARKRTAEGWKGSDKKQAGGKVQKKAERWKGSGKRRTAGEEAGRRQGAGEEAERPDRGAGGKQTQQRAAGYLIVPGSELKHHACRCRNAACAHTKFESQKKVCLSVD